MTLVYVETGRFRGLFSNFAEKQSHKQFFGARHDFKGIRPFQIVQRTPLEGGAGPEELPGASSGTAGSSEIEAGQWPWTFGIAACRGHF